MCMTCGCGEPNEKHGDERNITWAEVQDAAKAAGITDVQAVWNIEATYQDVVKRSTTYQRRRRSKR